MPERGGDKLLSGPELIQKQLLLSADGKLPYIYIYIYIYISSSSSPSWTADVACATSIFCHYSVGNRRKRRNVSPFCQEERRRVINKSGELSQQEEINTIPDGRHTQPRVYTSGINQSNPRAIVKRGEREEESNCR